MKIAKSRPLSPQKTNSITIVIALYNEQDNIEPMFTSLRKVFDELGHIFPVLIINDGSSDHSGEILTNLQNQCSFLKVINHEYSQGLTRVLQTAVEASNTDWLYLSPGDLESQPQIDFPLLYNACQPGIDAVAGWRKGRKDGKVLASKFANLTCRLLFNLKIHDMNWIKLVRRDLLVNLPLDKVTHAYFLAVLAGLGYSIIEVSTPWYPRVAGKSKFGIKRLIPSAIKFWQLWWWTKTGQLTMNNEQAKKM